MPATTMLVFVIFVDPCLVKRTKLFRQPSGPDEGADDDHATGQPQAAQGGLDPIASRSAADGRPRQSIPFGTPDDNRSRYYKGGQSEACPPIWSIIWMDGGHGALRLCPPYETRIKPPGSACRRCIPDQP